MKSAPMGALIQNASCPQREALNILTEVQSSIPGVSTAALPGEGGEAVAMVIDDMTLQVTTTAQLDTLTLEA